MYLVDSNVLIDAKNRYYAFDIAPGFWTWLEAANTAGDIGSIDAVQKELIAGDDELADWARANSSFFRPMDAAAVAQFGPLTTWTQSQPFTPAAKATFAGNQSDYQLVAYARGHDDIVVTHELSSPNAKARVKIPDACAAIGAGVIGPFEMMRRTGARWQ